MSAQLGLFAARPPERITIDPSRREREFKKRDAAIAAHKETKARLVGDLRDFMARLYYRVGPLTTGRAHEEALQVPALAKRLVNVDKRVWGAVVKHPGFREVGLVPEGSHGRRVSVWEWRGR